MHSCSEVSVYTNNDVIENEGTSCIKLNLNNLLISNAECFCISGCEVDVSLCGDNALCKLNLSARTNELNAGSSCNVSALSYGSNETEGSCIGERKLNLSCGTNGSENDNVRNGLLRSFNGKTLLASELTGLAEVLLSGELIALAEEDINSFS